MRATTSAGQARLHLQRRRAEALRLLDPLINRQPTPGYPIELIAGRLMGDAGEVRQKREALPASSTRLPQAAVRPCPEASRIMVASRSTYGQIRALT
jgi:hypothetical protein